MAVHMLCCTATRIIDVEEDRLRALQHVCSALPRTTRALDEQARLLGCAQGEGCAAIASHALHMCSALRARDYNAPMGLVAAARAGCG